MSRVRVIYQNEAVYVGPPKISGGSNESIFPGNNILKNISNVQGVQYGISVNHQDVAMLGKRGTERSVVVTKPAVSFSMTYGFEGFTNEKKLGFDLNYRTGDVSYVDDTFSLFLISGFASNADRTLDKRNFYIAVADEGNDLLNNETSFDSSSISTIIDDSSPNYDIITFHDCYLESYTFQAAVGGLATCDLDYVVESISFATSGSGVDVLTYDNKTRDLKTTGINAVIPKFYRPDGPKAIPQGDITLDITETSGSAPESGFGFNFSDIKIQKFNLTIDLQRDQLNSITHKAPIDRPIIFPVGATLQVESIVGDVDSGNFAALAKQDDFYDLNVKLYNSANATDTRTLGSSIIARKAKLESVNYGLQIGDNKNVSLSFKTELKEEDLTYGVFFSGILNTGDIEKFLLESGAL